ncbi:MAG: hypothetical protein K5755_05820 [Clostridiales bacterium]|nr:hypothetical protein [Clostridiales bacterium]
MKKAYKLIVVLLLLSFMFSACSKAPAEVDGSGFVTSYPFIFVHGLSGWGSYDKQNKYIPYWGMFTGDLMEYLNDEGFECYSASVDPTGSAWDRACELYAQLTGSVVDYGEEHSKRCNHERFGRDFSDTPLIEKWDSEHKINLLGHSFGGATVRLLTELLANGSDAEKKATDKDDLSPLFEGGKADWVYSLTALAAPMNGTTAYDIDGNESLGDDLKSKIYEKLNKMMSVGTREKDDGRADYDNANFDMLIDNAKKMNEGIETLDNLYYFSIPCCSTTESDDGTQYPDESKTEPLFMKPSILMGKFTEITPDGFVVDESWQMNDGLVNTVSATAPFNAPQQPYDEKDVKRGVWNVMPTYDGDHMSLQGGITKRNDVRDFYTELLTMICKLK